MSFKLDYDNSGLSKGMDKLGAKMGAVILMYSATKAQQFQSQMKTNRPWTDRTNMAKAMLSASVSQPDFHTVRITLAHGVEYGIWLELAHEKNYAVIAPTIREVGPKLISDMGDLMSKIK